MTISIEGTYELTRRVLPDGTELEPPMVRGIATFGDGVRHFSVLWHDADGNPRSKTYAARYAIRDNIYHETSEYTISHGQYGELPHYDLGNQMAEAPVIQTDSTMAFSFPQPHETDLAIRVEFDDRGFVATADGFIDHWERVR